jgi:hypothetical protein
MQEEKETENETVETQGTRDFTKQIKEFEGIAKETFRMGMDFNISLFEINLKVLRHIADQWHWAEEACMESIKDSCNKVPTISAPFENANSKPLEKGIDQFIAFRNDYVNAVREISDEAAEESISIAKNFVNKASSAFEVYINALVT